MAGAALTRYMPVVTVRVEAMKRHSRAGGKPAKALPRKALKLKGRKAFKTISSRGLAPAGQETEVARLTRELNEAHEQQTATSEVLQIIPVRRVTYSPRSRPC